MPRLRLTIGAWAVVMHRLPVHAPGVAERERALTLAACAGHLAQHEAEQERRHLDLLDGIPHAERVAIFTAEADRLYRWTSNLTAHAAGAPLPFPTNAAWRAWREQNP